MTNFPVFVALACAFICAAIAYSLITSQYIDRPRALAEVCEAKPNVGLVCFK